MDIVLETASSSVPVTSALNIGEDSRTVNQDNHCQYYKPTNTAKENVFNSNSLTSSASCTSIRSGGGNISGSSTSSSTTSVSSGGSGVNSGGHNGNYHGNPNRTSGYYRPHLRQNFNNYGHYNNGNGNNYNNGGGRQGGYNNAGNAGGYNSGGYHQNNLNGQTNGGYRRNYANKRHYQGEYYPHQNQGQGGHHHYYHNHHYNMNSRSNVQQPQHLQPLLQNHNGLPPNASAVHGNHNHYHSHSASKPLPAMTMYPLHCWPTMETEPMYKSFSNSDTDSVHSSEKDVVDDSPCPPTQWFPDITIQFDVKAPPPPITISLPPPMYPPTWLPPSAGDSEQRFHSNETEHSNTDDPHKDSRLMGSRTSSVSPIPKSSLLGQGDMAGRYTFPYYAQNFQQRIDPDVLVEAFKFFEIKMTPALVAPKDSEWASLSQAVWNKFQANQQTTETFRKKMELWRDIYDIIRHIFPAYGLQVVGSTMSGFGSNTSDVDMCLLIRRSEVDQRFEAVDCLHNLWSILRDMPFLDKTEVIYAKVPILKFRDSMRYLEVDLNCNNSVGIRNTHLLYCYSQQDWRVRPLVLLVKMWAQYHGINDAKNMTISSYSLVLMVIHFLQYGVSPAPPVLPCLQQTFTEKYSYLMDLVKLRSSFHDVVETPFALPEPFESKNTQTLGELLVNFLHYFAVQFDYASHAVSVRNGSVLSIKSCMSNRARKNDAHQWKYICIEEPFEFTNTARSVYDRDVFDRIRGIFFASWQRLYLTNDLESIFTVIQLSEARNIGIRLRHGEVILVFKKLANNDPAENLLAICPAESSQVETEAESSQIETEAGNPDNVKIEEGHRILLSPDLSDSEETIQVYSTSDEDT